MKIINATPHQIIICSKEGVTQDPKTKQFTAETVTPLFTLPPSGIIPRVAIANTESEPILGIPVQSVQYGEIEGLPEPSPDVFYVVSGLVASLTATKSQIKLTPMSSTGGFLCLMLLSHLLSHSLYQKISLQGVAKRD